MVDTRFASALQIVMSLAYEERNGTRCTSDAMARAMGANSSLVRKLLVALGRAGITVASVGGKGGMRLAKPAESINLRDVYLAVIENKPLLSARADVPCLCTVSSNIGELFERVATDAQNAMLESLARRTVADAIKEIENIDQLRKTVA
jgi:Rrf2 family transcriptional regulator, repressor of oqxAB